MSLFFFTVLILAVAGLPLFLVLAVIALIGFHFEGLPFTIFFAEFIRLAENQTLIAIPLFTFAGYILAESKAADRLVRVAKSLLWWLPGEMSVITLGIMALFTAFTGASGVTIVAMGGMMLPSLLKSGFSERFALGLVTVSGSVGLLFPPSLPLIIYAIVTETPVDQMFIGGILPGILMILGLSLFGIRNGWKQSKSQTRKKTPLLPALKEAAWEIPLPVVVIGGIYTGTFTIGEAAIVTVLYLLIVEIFIIKDIHFQRDLPRIIRESSILIGGILLILGAALAVTNYLVFTDVPMKMLDWIQTWVDSKLMFLIMLNLFLLLMGCLMDVFSALVVLVPLIFPIAMGFGIHPVHLGIIFLTNLEIGYNTPPVGLNLFISSFRFEKPVLTLYRATLPFLAIQIIILLIVTYIPFLTIFPLKIFGY